MTETRPLRSYGRRKSKPLSARKERLIAELLPRLRLDLADKPPAQVTSLFATPVKEVWLEIGFGSGEHLLWQAERNPEIGFIGCEPFLNGLATLLGEVEDRGLAAIRGHDGDAREVLAWLPERSIGRIFILYPDPWPKKRHLKRRLLSPETAGQLARMLKPGGELRFASDDADYVAEARLLARQSGAFAESDASANGPQQRPADWPETRYERKALSEGRKSAYLSWRRVRA
jgi:tRNA (guanine-N7-)-methyltransferase